ncbi:MAG: hypothetical protein ACP6IY_20780 [Promethearchaeia archaeon]
MKNKNMLNSEKLDKEKLYSRDLPIGIGENIFFSLLLFFYIYIFNYITPPISLLIPFLQNQFNFYMVFYFIPLISITVVEVIFYFQKRKKRNEIKGNKLLPIFTYYLIPMNFILYIPLNFIELILWMITFIGLYIGFYKERFPLIKYSIDLYHIELYRINSSKASLKNAIVSLDCIFISIWIFLILVSFKIYPIPALLLFYLKYYLIRRYFKFDDDNIFYESDRYYSNIIFILNLLIGIISGCIIGVAIYIIYKS